MVFSSITFLFYFLPIFLALYFVTPTIKAKNIVTLVFSLLFYAWGEPQFILVLLFSIAFNFLAALAIDSREGSARKGWRSRSRWREIFSFSAIFKYANFLTANLAGLLAPLGLGGRDRPTSICRSASPSSPSIACPTSSTSTGGGSGPIAIRSMSRSISRSFRNSSRGRSSATRPSPANWTRAGSRSAALRSGARIFIIGLAQKVLVADVVAPLVQVAFDQVHTPIFVEAWIGLISYTVQIYFDFAGYSNMAIGLGIVLGFTFPRNFRMPYTSLSITEFWRRWHMSLSSWLRDYLYIPLGGNRGSNAQNLPQSRHGVPPVRALARGELDLRPVGRLARRLPGDRAARAWTPSLARLATPARWAYALIAVMGGWVLFRSADLTAAIGYYREPPRRRRLERDQLRHARRAERTRDRDARHRLRAGGRAEMARQMVGAVHLARAGRRCASRSRCSFSP